jgi:NAD(P)H-dependent FMN reductase
MSVKLLALAASSRTESLNRSLLALAIKEAERAGATITMLDYATCDAPLYRDEAGATLPAGAQVLSAALRAHDGLILASPEYNWSIPGELKNLIDWLSTDPTMPLNGRTALLLCATPSSRGGIIGLQQLSVPLEHLGMWVYPRLIGIGGADAQLQHGVLCDPKDQQYLASCVTDFVARTNAWKKVSHAS